VSSIFSIKLTVTVPVTAWLNESDVGTQLLTFAFIVTNFSLLSAPLSSTTLYFNKSVYEVAHLVASEMYVIASTSYFVSVAASPLDIVSLPDVGKVVSFILRLSSFDSWSKT